MPQYKCSPDTLVQFTTTLFIEPNNIIFEGMYGVVVDDPYVQYICTPGVSTFIQVLGRTSRYGYGDECFEAVEIEPSDDELYTSAYIAQHAFEIFEEHFGYSGFIKKGKKIHPQEKYFRELIQLVGKIMEWSRDAKYFNQIDGNLKHIRKVLKAFRLHPLASDAEALSEKLKEVKSTSPDLLKWLCEIKLWVSRAEDIERLETQSDRMTQARRDRNYIELPFPGLE